MSERPIKILQFGEGNFLRAFADYFIDIANEAGVFNGNVQIVKAIKAGDLAPLLAQNCEYTVLLRGIRNGAQYVEKRKITAIAGATDAYADYEEYATLIQNPDLQFIISNTTEAGIVYDETDRRALTPPNSFPGKLTKLLFERYVYFNGDRDKGLIILPVELIEQNGEKLRSCCMKLAALWGLSDDFTAWLTECNIFCNTLVDRIVTGYPKEEAAALEQELGYRDKMLVAGEPFALWVIAHEKIAEVAEKFPLDKTDLPVIFTQDLTPYRERKVRILNGAHTSGVLAAYLAGVNTVGEMMNDAVMRPFIERAIFDELSPCVPLPADEVKAFARSVIERFENPFIQHNLLSIALNSVSKFKVRVLPTILETQAKTGTLPQLLCFSFAALAQFYCTGERDGKAYDLKDDSAVLAFFAKNKALSAQELTSTLLKREDFWGQNLTQISGLESLVAQHLDDIRTHDMRDAVKALVQ
ncbi:MAG: tagaturonate reductase [Defluviitaleaceae bacterium]|nr:tagaturonate reductase [Defluviitaleaceae bacterium]MCL2275221.1 tagaturonate reductase [Defluviitaleaceae bacterium]